MILWKCQLYIMGVNESVRLFSYGANMNVKVLQKRNVSPQKTECARLINYFLCFNHQGGFGNVKPVEDNLHASPQVHGVVHFITKEELEKMKVFETGYEIRDLEVVLYSGETSTAKCFVSSKGAETSLLSLSPTKRYLKLLQEGSAFYNLDPNYQSWLMSLDGIEDDDRGPEYYETKNKVIAQFVAGVVLVTSLWFYCSVIIG